MMKKFLVTAVCVATLGTLTVPSAFAQVVNGNFGTGDFTGWTTTSAGDPYYTSVTNSAPAPGATYAANIGAYYDDSIPANLIQGYVKQTVATTPGDRYTLSFLYGEQNGNPSFSFGSCSNCWYLDPDNITTSTDPGSNIWAQNNNLNVLWNGVSVDSASNFFTSDPANVNATTNSDDGKSIGDYFYDKASVVVTATGSSTVLEFDASDYQQGIILTDISLTALPAPEPGTLALLASGLAGLAFLVRRRRQGSAF
jgi:hypothetical protein